MILTSLINYLTIHLWHKDLTWAQLIVKAMIFPVVMYRCESWNINKAENQRIDAFELWCWQRLLRIPWTARRFSTVQFSRSVVSDSLWPHESQHTRLPCPSPNSEFTQTHVHRVSDAIQPFHPTSPLLLLPSFFQHQGLFQWVGSLHQVAKVLEFQLQQQSFQWIFRTDFL